MKKFKTCFLPFEKTARVSPTHEENQTQVWVIIAPAFFILEMIFPRKSAAELASKGKSTISRYIIRSEVQQHKIIKCKECRSKLIQIKDLKLN